MRAVSEAVLSPDPCTTVRPQTSCRPRTTAHSGFTLLEVLVTVALVVIVLGLTGSTLISSLRATPRTQLQARQEIELLRVTAVLQRQLQTMARSLQGSSALSGKGGERPHTDEITLLTPGLLHHAGVGLAEWSIVQDGDAPPYLAYRETPYDGGQSLGRDPRYPFSTMVRGMDVRYLSAPDYLKSWQRPDPPERVRVTLWYPVEGGQDSTTFETVIGLSQQPSPVPDGGLDVVDDTLRARPSPSPTAGPTVSPTSSSQAPSSPLLRSLQP